MLICEYFRDLIHSLGRDEYFVQNSYITYIVYALIKCYLTIYIFAEMLVRY